MSDAERQAYKQKTEAQLDEMKAKLDVLRARAAGASADAKVEMAKKVDDLSDAYDSAKQRLAEMADSGEDMWDEAKVRFEGAWDTAQKRLSQLGD